MIIMSVELVGQSHSCVKPCGKTYVFPQWLCTDQEWCSLAIVHKSTDTKNLKFTTTMKFSAFELSQA
jgi:hypothetical protein